MQYDRLLLTEFINSFKNKFLKGKSFFPSNLLYIYFLKILRISKQNKILSIGV